PRAFDAREGTGHLRCGERCRAPARDGDSRDGHFAGTLSSHQPRLLRSGDDRHRGVATTRTRRHTRRPAGGRNALSLEAALTFCAVTRVRRTTSYRIIPSLRPSVEVRCNLQVRATRPRVDHATATLCTCVCGLVGGHAT